MLCTGGNGEEGQAAEGYGQKMEQANARVLSLPCIYIIQQRSPEDLDALLLNIPC